MEVTIIKIGGSCLNREVEKTIRNVVKHYAGQKLIIVHGFGKSLSDFLKKEKIERRSFVSLAGLKSYFTEENILAISYMVALNLREKVTQVLCESGFKAKGVSGCDNLAVGDRKKIIRYKEENTLKAFKGDFSGENIRFNLEKLNDLLQEHDALVVSPIVSGTEGGILSCNGDKIAIELARQLEVKKIVFVSDTKYVYADDKPLETIYMDQLQEVKKFTTGGMYKKITYIQNALKSGVESIDLLNGLEEHLEVGTIFYNYESISC